MEELIIPNAPKNDTGGPLPEGYNRYVFPPTMTVEDKMAMHQGILNNVVAKEMELDRKIDGADKKIEEYKKDIERQSSKAIEIIGIFSAILALLIVDVSIVKSVTSFLSAILLISALTCSMVIFAVLIHSLFAPQDKIKFGKLFWFPIIFLILYIILGVLAYSNNWF